MPLFFCLEKFFFTRDELYISILSKVVLIIFYKYNLVSLFQWLPLDIGSWTIDAWLSHLSVLLNYEICKIKLYWSNALIN